MRRSNKPASAVKRPVSRPDGRREEPKRIPSQAVETPRSQGNGTAVSAVSRPTKVRKRTKSDFIKPTDVVRVKGSYDTIFLVLVIVLTLFGIIMDFSASYAYAFSRYQDSFYFVKRQILWVGIGLVGMFVAMKFDYRWIRKLTIPIFLGVMALLVIVLVYGVASGVAQRWIKVGPVTVQPSELMKFALVFLLALYVSRNQDRITNYRNFWQSSTYGMFIPVGIVGIVCLLVALEKHFSGTIIIFMIGMIVIFAGGARKSWFFAIGGSGLALLAGVIMLFPYARERIMMLWHPENYDPEGKIWQTLQGLYAVGSGGLFGVGLGNSRQKHMFVSQPQNDFIFSIIAEELGFAGASLVIVLFMLLIWRGFVIALKAPDTFSSLVAIGLTTKVGLQAILNIAVVINLIPNTGISLPFFSYGGTALVTQLCEMGVILSISRYSYQRET
ncbi:MAG: putative lipid II flippase FtsW [Clostridia bacterium]|nr:putative lipid II flippase FtsW [Clostridia bacterium]